MRSTPPGVTSGTSSPSRAFSRARAIGEIQLTSALDRLRREDGFLGLVMEGRRYDIGLPQHYLETLATFSQHEMMLTPSPSP